MVITKLAEALRDARKRQKLSQVKAAEHFRVSRTTYLCWERGQRPKAPHFRDIAGFCEMDLTAVVDLVSGA